MITGIYMICFVLFYYENEIFCLEEKDDDFVLV